MPPLGFLIIVYFLIVAFTSVRVSQQVTNPFLSYYELQLKFIYDHKLWFFLLLTLLVLFIFLSHRKKKHRLNNLVHFTKKIISLSIVGSVISLLFIFIIALLDVNVLSVLTYVNIKALGVEDNAQTIVDKLKQSADPPVVIAGNDNANILPLTIAIAGAGKNSFFGGVVIPFVPNFLILPARKLDAGVLMEANTLIVRQINSKDFQKVSPVVSYQFINKYFHARFIKSFPQVELMDKNEYLRYRKEDFSEKLKKFDEVIAKINEDSTLISEDIKNLEQKISDNKINLDNTSRQKEKDYTKCINTGYYQQGIYHRTNEISFCQSLVSGLEDDIKKLTNDKEDLVNSLKQQKSKYDQYQAYYKFFSNQKLLTEDSGNFISYESGTFNPPDVIKVALAPKNSPESLADFFELLVHEYLHYASYDANGKKISSPFFVEGLTEYFAREIIKSNLGVQTNLAYPANVKIVEQINKRISDTDLSDIYFKNNEIALEKILNRVYGEDFYNKNIVLFETLHYSSNPDQILTPANEIMQKIGGEPLVKSDLSTKHSTFF